MNVVPAVRAKPKSNIFSVQSDLTTMLDGFKSYFGAQKNTYKAIKYNESKKIKKNYGTKSARRTHTAPARQTDAQIESERKKDNNEKNKITEKEKSH